MRKIESFTKKKIAELENDVDYWQDRALEAESNLEDEDYDK